MATATTGVNSGVWGQTASSGGYGVRGLATSATGTNYGVYGQTNSAGGRGINGLASSTSGLTYGVYGQANSSVGTGVYGLANSSSGSNFGVVGASNSTDGVGVMGITSANGNTVAVLAENQASTGNAYGVFATTTSPGGAAVYAQGPTGMHAVGNSGYAIVADGGLAVNGPTGIVGHLVVNGDLDVSGDKNFRIDHPLDPANKYLYHASIESYEVLNLYNGNTVLDGHGEAWVELPVWMEVLNREFRYQLTAIGAPGPNLFVAEEIHNNRFKISGGSPRMKVSWQITGIRNDPYRQAHPFVVERDKPAVERGYYQHPELHGQPDGKRLRFAPRPQSASDSDKKHGSMGKR
jgi:hypothetical protein